MFYGMMVHKNFNFVVLALLIIFIPNNNSEIGVTDSDLFETTTASVCCESCDGNVTEPPDITLPENLENALIDKNATLCGSPPIRNITEDPILDNSTETDSPLTPLIFNASDIVASNELEFLEESDNSSTDSQIVPTQNKCDPFIASVEDLEYIYNSLKNVTLTKENKYDAKRFDELQSECNSNETLSHIVNSIRALNKIFLASTDASLQGNVFLNRRLTFELKLKELQTLVENVRRNLSPHSVQYRKLSFILFETLNMKIKSQSIYQGVVSQRNKNIKKKIHYCLGQIRSVHDYSDCESLSNFMMHDNELSRTLIHSSYQNDLASIDQIITYITQLKNVTHKMVSLDALLEEMINDFNFDNSRVIIIYRKIDEWIDSHKLGPLNTTISDKLKSLAESLKFLLSRPIDAMITVWAEEIKGNKFENFATFARECPECLDLVEHYSTNQSVIVRITKYVYNNDMNHISTILKLNSHLPALSQNVQCLEILISEMVSNNHLRTPMVFLVNNTLREIIERQSKIQNNAEEVINRTTVLVSQISIPIRKQLKSWANFIQNNKFENILNFSSQYNPVFELVLPELVQAAYDNRTDNVESVLNFASKLPEITQYIKAVMVLAEDCSKTGQLNSPTVFLLNFAVKEIHLKILHEQIEFSDEFESILEQLKNSLQGPIGNEINRWAKLITNNNYDSISNFSRYKAAAFELIIDKLVISTYSNDAVKLVPILNFALDLPNTTHTINCYRVLVNEMIRVQGLNNLMVFVLDEYIDRLLAELQSNTRDIRSEVTIFKSQILSAKKKQIKTTANLLDTNRFSSFTRFASQHPIAFERDIGDIIKSCSVSADSTIYSILQFATSLTSNITQTTKVQTVLVETMTEHSRLHTPLVITVDYDMGNTKNNTKFIMVPNSMKTHYGLLKESLSNAKKSEISRLAELLKNEAWEELVKLCQKYPASYNTVLGTIVAETYSKDIRKVDSLMDFGEKVSDFQNILVFEGIMEAIKSSGHLSQGKIFIIKKRMDVFHTRKQSRLSEESKTKYGTVISKARTNCNSAISIWASNIQSGSYGSISSFANANKELIQPYLHQLLYESYLNNHHNAPNIMNFMASLNLELASKMIGKFHSYYYGTMSEWGDRWRTYLTFLKNMIWSGSFSSLSSSDQNSWTTIKNSFSCLVRGIMFQALTIHFRDNYYEGYKLYRTTRDCYGKSGTRVHSHKNLISYFYAETVDGTNFKFRDYVIDLRLYFDGDSNVCTTSGGDTWQLQHLGGHRFYVRSSNRYLYSDRTLPTDNAADVYAKDDKTDRTWNIYTYC